MLRSLDVQGRERERGRRKKNIGHCFESERRDDKPDYIHDRWCRDEYLTKHVGNILGMRKGGNFDAFCVIGCAFHSRSPISWDLLCLHACNLRVQRYTIGRRNFSNREIRISKYHYLISSWRDKSGTRNLSIN